LSRATNNVLATSPSLLPTQTLRPHDASGTPQANDALPLVSIVIPHRNQKRWLRACLESCLAQTYPCLEILLIDDASSEDITPLVDAFRARAKDRLTMHLKRLPARLGPGGARNAGIGMARGELVQFLDADDYIHPEKIARQVAALQATQADAAIASWRFVFDIGPVCLPGPVEPIRPPETLLAATIADRDQWFPVMACLFRRDLLERIGAWNEVDWNEDREFRYRLLKESPSWTPTPGCLFFYRRYTAVSRVTEPEISQTAAAALLRSDLDHLDRVRRDLEGNAVDRTTCIPAFRLFQEGLRVRLANAQGLGVAKAMRRTPLSGLKTLVRRFTSAETRFRWTNARGYLNFLTRRWLARAAHRIKGTSH
jgi:glycosyltransferase involved in cell wall biosynthesis